MLCRIAQHGNLKQNDHVLEIGCGDLALSRYLLAEKICRLAIVEYDEKWAHHAKSNLSPSQTTVYHSDICVFDFSQLLSMSPTWSVIANIPYYITYEILHLLVSWKANLKQGIIMIQEEVAQKLVKKRGRDYTPFSLFIQYHFDCTLLDKVPPTAFFPEPKVYSRVIQLVPKQNVEPLKNEDAFWKFLKIIFKSPRRTILNNIQGTLYLDTIPEIFHKKRAQEFSLEELIILWNQVDRH